MSIPNAPFGLLGNAPMQTQLVDGQRSVTPPWGGWLNWLRQWLFLNIPSVINSKGVYSSADPLANGAAGDGVTDDTLIIQQTINNTNGILYLRPGIIFKVTSTLTLPTSSVLNLIYGGGIIVSTAATAISMTSSSANTIISDVVINGPPAGTVLSFASGTAGWNNIRNCRFGANSTATTASIALNANAAGWNITGCTFAGGGGNTGIVLTSQLDVNIVGCEFLNGTPVSTSGTCSYNVRGCGTALDSYETGAASATATAGGGAAVPATVKTFIEVQIVLAGVQTIVKIPAFSV